MPKHTRLVLQIVGTLALISAIALFFWGRRNIKDPASLARGEEVYASHDCTDCHLATHVLKQKREKKEVGLIRVRTEETLLQKFLESDKRHQSYVMISPSDRQDLLEYLKSLVPKNP